MARPKRRRKPRVVVVYRVPAFGAVARPCPLDEDRATIRTGGHHRPKIPPNQMGVGEWSFFNATANTPDKVARETLNYDCEQKIAAIMAQDQDLLLFARNAVRLRDMENSQNIVWDRVSEMNARWRAATAWR